MNRPPLSVYISADASARALGADRIAREIVVRANAAARAITIVRTGSRGMVWAEPLVEVETTGGRIAYGR